MNWSLEQIEALAPDAGSLKRGQGLATNRKWGNLGHHGAAIWGECQGSGKKPYYTRIDLTEPAYKCSCPSRKFPCKHSLGLMLLFAKSAEEFPLQSPPEWVADWIAQRAARQQKAVTPPAQKAPDEAAQAARAAQRINNIRHGLTELKNWLLDIVRLGLADLSQQDYAYWEERAARMVDAQAGGIANIVKGIHGCFLKKNWQEEALAQIGLLHLLIASFERWDAWDSDFQATLKGVAGVNVKKEELAEKAGITDHWQVLGRWQEADGELDMLRTWIWGKESKRYALLLDFAYGGRGFQQSFLPGSAFHGEVVFYPGREELRGHVKLPVTVAPMDTVVSEGNALEAMLWEYATVLGKNPFLFRFPTLLEGLTPIRHEGGFALFNPNQEFLPLASVFQKDWELIALSGGKPLALFGEWDGKNFLPLAAKDQQRWISFV